LAPNLETDKSAPRHVLIADDEASVRHALGRVIDSIDGFECVGQIATADPLISSIITLHPDVILLDLKMPGRDVIEAILEICQYLRYRCHVVVISGLCAPTPIQTVMALGAVAYVVKEDGPEAIRRALQQVIDGKKWLSPSAAALFAPGQLPMGASADPPYDTPSS
jgi:DNA-binding NarL/FixJ family response regulator